MDPDPDPSGAFCGEFLLKIRASQGELSMPSSRLISDKLWLPLPLLWWWSPPLNMDVIRSNAADCGGRKLSVRVSGGWVRGE